MLPSSPDPLLGRVLGGRYRVERTLGGGGAGAVYDAVQLDLGRHVALKVLRPELATDSIELERFRREARTAAALGHPHIAQVLEFAGPNGDEPAFIVQELIAGVSLFELLRGGPLEPSRAVALATQILAGLEAAHAAGVVHRDLKPGNVMVTEIAGVGEVAKIVDFGIARVQEGAAYQRLTRTGVIVGTPRYMSPEQASGRPIDGRSDLWAVGVMTYRMLAGRFPFESKNPVELLQAIVERPTPPMPVEAAVPAALETAVARSLEKSPDHRWSDARAMSDGLRGALASAPPAEPRAPATQISMSPSSVTPIVHATRAAMPIAPMPIAPMPIAPPIARGAPRWVYWIMGGLAGMFLLSTCAAFGVALLLAPALQEREAQPASGGYYPAAGEAPAVGGYPPPVEAPAIGVEPPRRGTLQTFLDDAEARARARDPSARLYTVSCFGFDPATGTLDYGAGAEDSQHRCILIFSSTAGPNIGLGYNQGIDPYPAMIEAAPQHDSLPPGPDSPQILATAIAMCPRLGSIGELAITIAPNSGTGVVSVIAANMDASVLWTGTTSSSGLLAPNPYQLCR